MTVSICIATVRPTTLGAAVASIQAQTWTNWELVVVGQGPDRDIRSRLEEVSQGDSRVCYIHLSERGLSRARNAGIAASTGDIIAMTDDDCEAHPEWIATLVRCFETEPDVGLVGGALLKPDGVRRGVAACPALRPAEVLYDPIASGRQAPRGWNWVGGNFAIRRDVAQQVGAFDEYLGAGTSFASGEDTDYKLRLEALGIKMRSTPRAVVYHTYGVRYGLQARLQHSRNYARGNGAMAGKLTLLGDPRGREWLEMTRRECTVGWFRRVKQRRMPVNLLRLWHFTRAYQECIRDYRADPARVLLYPARAAAARRT